jgi:amino acid transporter
VSVVSVAGTPPMVTSVDPIAINKCCKELFTNESIKINSDCCKYVSDPEKCKECWNTVLKGDAKDKTADLIKGIVFIGFLVLLHLILIVSSIRIRLKDKRFFHFTIGKIICCVLVLLISIWSVFQIEGIIRGKNVFIWIIETAIASIYWPFLAMLGLENVIFTNVDWAHAKDVPFILVAVILSAIYVYTISCLIIWLKNKILGNKSISVFAPTPQDNSKKASNLKNPKK